jgi:hypothetical protein
MRVTPLNVALIVFALVCLVLLAYGGSSSLGWPVYLGESDYALRLL